MKKKTELNINDIIEIAESVSDTIFDSINTDNPEAFEKLMPTYSSLRAKRSKWKDIGMAITALFIMESFERNNKPNNSIRIKRVIFPYIKGQKGEDLPTRATFFSLLCDLMTYIYTQEKGQIACITVAEWIVEKLSDQSYSDEALDDIYKCALKICINVSLIIDDILFPDKKLDGAST